MTPHRDVFDLRESLMEMVQRFSRFRRHWTDEDRRAVSDALRLLTQQITPATLVDPQRVTNDR